MVSVPVTATSIKIVTIPSWRDEHAGHDPRPDQFCNIFESSMRGALDNICSELSRSIFSGASAQAFLRDVFSSSSLISVAYENDREHCGDSLGLAIAGPSKEKGIYAVKALGVVRHARNQGIGTALYKQLKEQAAKNGAHTLCTQALSAQNFFRRVVGKETGLEARPGQTIEVLGQRIPCKDLVQVAWFYDRLQA